jgi:multifunctional 2-oxoglutarate metabolism enzyme
MWLIDEMYRLFLDDPESVSEAWREFFEDYQPGNGTPGGTEDQAPEGGEEPPPVESPDGKHLTQGTEKTPEPTAVPEAKEDTPVVEAGQPSAKVENVEGPLVQQLRGAAAIVAERMEASRDIPTATSVRTVPAKLLEVNRQIINNHSRI